MPTLRKKMSAKGIVTPCGTPTLPTVAPGRAMAMAVCTEVSLPTHSSTASTPTFSSVKALTLASPSVVSTHQDDPLSSQHFGCNHAA